MPAPLSPGNTKHRGWSVTRTEDRAPRFQSTDKVIKSMFNKHTTLTS